MAVPDMPAGIDMTWALTGIVATASMNATRTCVSRRTIGWKLLPTPGCKQAPDGPADLAYMERSGLDGRRHVAMSRASRAASVRLRTFNLLMILWTCTFTVL